MKEFWKKRTEDDIKDRIFEALDKNAQFNAADILGVPASYLDEKFFSQHPTFLKDRPFMSTLAQNPNHIGCHTLGESEHFFAGTQAIEKELIEICAVDILKGEPYQQDGYIASGGTEANMQAIWIYRNYFMRTHKAKRDEICILCSSDSHYSIDKAANVLAIDIEKVPVEDNTRVIRYDSIKKAIETAQKRQQKYFIVVANMMTTMFGSVDDVTLYVNALTDRTCPFKVHVDGAYGGFYYPFANEEDTTLSFANPHITSFTLDAHKMAQAPYGTGIFLIRKNYIHYANTKASYVEGDDCTLIGSRSGANAIAVWMILAKYGPYGWDEKIFVLQKRTAWLCAKLTEIGIHYYRHSSSNIITIRSECMKPEIAQQFGLVPDNHNHPKWYKIVIMAHVTIEKLESLVDLLSSSV